MATQFILVRWKAEGLRCPDHEIILCDAKGNPNPVTLIQMPNGTGKTTTLKLLRAALSGEAVEWSPETVRSLQKRGSTATSGRFLLECLCDQKRLTIVLGLDFEEGRASYSTTSGSGNKAGFHPPAALRRFLQKDFVRLFVFDGEQAEHLLDHHYTNAHDAIDSLFQLKFFEGMRAWVDEYWEDHVKTAKAGDPRALARRQNRVDLLTQRLKVCRKAYREACAIRNQLREQLDKKKRQFRNELEAHEEYSKKLRAADNVLGEAKNRVQAKANEVHARIRDPHALSPIIAYEIAELRANLDRVKLPESTAREFFEELALETECVCGRPLDQACRDHIREKASRYLGSDDVSLLNAMKSDIADLLGAQPQDHASQLDALLQDLKSEIGRESQARTAKEAIESGALTKHPELVKINDEITKLQNELNDVQNTVDRYEDSNDSLGDESTFGIDILERRLKDAEKKLAEITHTLDLRTKRDVLNKILKDAHEMARISIAKTTVQQANKRIDTLMPTNAIRIKEIRNCLVLEGQEGGSMGETLSVAYAFLATFFNSAEHTFAFVVDSPAGSIDLGIRPRIADLVPKLTTQFVAFTISSERQGFSDRLQEKYRGATTFLTLFRKRDPALEKQAKAVQGCRETADGFLVPGIVFFNNFQIEKE